MPTVLPKDTLGCVKKEFWINSSGLQLEDDLFYQLSHRKEEMRVFVQAVIPTCKTAPTLQKTAMRLLFMKVYENT